MRRTELLAWWAVVVVVFPHFSAQSDTAGIRLLSLDLLAVGMV